MKKIIKFTILIILFSFLIQIAISDQQQNINTIINNNNNNNKENQENQENDDIDDLKIITRGDKPIISNNNNNNNNNNNKQVLDIDSVIKEGCKIIEHCKKCLESESSETFCLKTNHRIKLSCIDDSIQYIPCDIITNKIQNNNNNNNDIDDQNDIQNFNGDQEKFNNHNNNNNNKVEKTSAINILYFEIIVLVVFVFSIYFVKERKRITLQQNNERLSKQLSKV